MSSFRAFAPLIGIEKNGKHKIWNATVEMKKDGTNHAIATFEWGQIDGKKQITVREYTEGKNIGKKNETTPYEQCVFETNRKWIDKQEKEGYQQQQQQQPQQQQQQPQQQQPQQQQTQNKPLIKFIVKSSGSTAMTDKSSSSDKSSTDKSSGDKSIIYPMLAKTYEPTGSKNKRNNIIFPCLVQPKLDGLRCVAYAGLAQSRTGSYFKTVNHILEALAPFFKAHPNIALDGELYTMDIPFETLAGLIKKEKISEKDRALLSNVSYHIYDMIDRTNPSLVYSDRHAFLCSHLASIVSATGSPIALVETEKTTNISEFRDKFSKYISNGYEGVMLRNCSGVYRTNYRSDDLQKYKEFMEEEYVITGFKEGDGRDKGTVIWECQTAEKKVFNVRPRGTIESRRELFDNAAKYIGAKLTVVFQELSEQGVPRFPVGKAIREGY